MKNRLSLLLEKLKEYQPGNIILAIEIKELCETLDKDETLTDIQKEIVKSIKEDFGNSILNKTTFNDKEKISTFIKELEGLNSKNTIKILTKSLENHAEKELPVIKTNELDILNTFIRESLDHLEGIEENILKLETGFNKDMINAVFRPFHSIKGTSSYLGLAKIQKLSHSMETLLDKLRENKLEIDSVIIDTLLEGVDQLSNMIHFIQNIEANFDRSKDKLVLPDSGIDITPLVKKVEEIITSKETKKEKIKKSHPIGFPEELKGEFEIEADDNLNTIEENLLILETDPNKIEIYNDIFRALHTIKGNAGLLLSSVVSDNKQTNENEISYIKDLAHTAESIIQNKRDKKEILNKDEIAILIKTLDTLRLLLDSFKEGKGISNNLKNTLKDIITIQPEKSKTDIEEDTKSIAFVNILVQSVEAIKGGIRDLEGDGEAIKAAAKIERAFHNLLRLGKKVNHPLIINQSKEGINIVNSLKKGNKREIPNLVSRLNNILNKLETKGDRRQSTIAQQKTLVEEWQKKSRGQVLKVPEERIDSLLKLIMELGVSKNNLNEINKEIRLKGITPELLNDINLLSKNITKTADELQNNVMKIRLMSLNTVFSRFYRLVRDLSKNLGKKIQIKISGEETELDKTVIDLIGDPLVHIIRNSIDHGIGTPEERLQNGKPEIGTIKLSAYNMGQNVVIDIEDDGKGIDPDAIRKKAIYKGIIEEHAALMMDDNATLDLIFLPGFSTAKTVTDISGRGVGMDVVKTNIEKIGGTVGIKSKKGIGTTISLKIPLTLAINRGLEVEVNSEHYYIPLDFVLETVKIPLHKIRTYRNKRMIVIRNELLMLYDLISIFGENKKDVSDKEEIANIVILSINNRKIAVRVNGLYGEGEYMIRPLPELIKDMDIFSGVTITGRGKILLVIDPQKIF